MAEPAAETAAPHARWPLQDYLDRLEREAIMEALEKSRYNRTAAAKLLGITSHSARCATGWSAWALSERAPKPPRGWGEGGTLLAARQVRSPNCDSRPPGSVVRLLVVHGISLPAGRFGGEAIERLFTNKLDCEADPAHFYVRRDGALVQFVPCDLRAWHAGISRWKGRERCNDFSVGVELEGADDVPYTSAQYLRLARLTRALRRRYPLTDIAGHSDIAPGRKTDPGPAFDWRRYLRLLEPAR
jgi:AmpD protein